MRYFGLVLRARRTRGHLQLGQASPRCRELDAEQSARPGPRQHERGIGPDQVLMPVRSDLRHARQGRRSPGRDACWVRALTMHKHRRRFRGRGTRGALIVTCSVLAWLAPTAAAAESWAPPSRIDQNGLAGISCPTASFCVVVDASGYVLCVAVDKFGDVASSTDPAGSSSGPPI
jgi:hypothetical protein